MDFNKLASTAFSQFSGKGSIPLSPEVMGLLDDLISKGMFKNKQDFIQFAIKAYTMFSASGKGQPTPSNVMDILSKTGFNKGSASESDVKGELVPLLIDVFQSMSRSK